jgi:NADP-dependent 3-hydroxy acid dehydrogenase YdfG
MKYIIVITGASSGFGEVTARALAKAGHIVYASMRETVGRNKEQVESAAQFAAENNAPSASISIRLKTVPR